MVSPSTPGSMTSSTTRSGVWVFEPVVGGGAVAEGVDLEALTAQVLGDHVAYRRLIVDDQNGPGAGGVLHADQAR